MFSLNMKPPHADFKPTLCISHIYNRSLLAFLSAPSLCLFVHRRDPADLCTLHTLGTTACVCFMAPIFFMTACNGQQPREKGRKTDGNRKGEER